MSSPGSVTFWINQLKKGDADAASEKLWNTYYEKLVRLAHARLTAQAGRTQDAEDVALSAFHSFVRAAAANRFPRLDDRDNLWALLLTITRRKAARLLEKASAQKHGAGRVRLHSELEGGDSDAGGGGLEAVAREPGPAEAVAVADECRRLLELLGDDRLRTVALCKLEGYTNREIGERLGRKEKTIERNLHLIRQTWEESAPTC